MVKSENLLNKTFKDHTVSNPIHDFSLKNLPHQAISVHNQPIRNIHATIQILEEDTMKVIETITGKAESGTLTVSGDSLTRRVLTLDLLVDESTFPKEDSLIWFNKVARVYMGISDNAHQGDVYNFLLGTFIIGEGDYGINKLSQRVKITFKDKMSKYEEAELEFPLKINRDTPINIAIQSVMEHIGETNFGKIADVLDREVVPYTLEYKAGEPVMTIVKALRDMYMDYTCGYDVEGNFEFLKIEQQLKQEVAEPKWVFDISDESNLASITSFNESYKFNLIKNRVVVYGATSQRTGITAQGESRVTDGNSPFNIYSIGERTKIVVDDKLVTDEQCIAKARYEVFKNSNFQEVCRVETVPIYFLDINDVITIRHPYTNEEAQYMIDDFSFGLGVDGMMSITAHKLYYITLEYGAEMNPLIDAFERGIYNYGWLSLAEERIHKVYNIIGSGTAVLSVRFQEVIRGGEQMSTTSYATTKNQTLMIDLADYENLDKNSPNGFVAERSRGDSAERVMAHEMFHVVFNDYVGHEKAILTPTYFKEGFAEFLHGARERFDSVYLDIKQSDKKSRLINLCKDILDGNFTGSSEDYVASYLIAIAIYRKLTKSQFQSMFRRIKDSPNIGINFLTKVVPIGANDAVIKELLLKELNDMTDVWNALFNKSDKDTGSIGGIHFMNLYGVALTDETVFNNDSAIEPIKGFQLKFIR